MKKKLITAVFAMVLFLTGCSSSDDDKSVSKNTGKETFTADTECNYAPSSWRTKEQMETSIPIGGISFCNGYDIRVTRRIAKDLDREIVIKKVSWNGSQPVLKSDEIDAITAGMTKDETCENRTNFTFLYYEPEMVMIVRKGDRAMKFSGIQQLEGRIIIRQKNTNYDTTINQIKGIEHATPRAMYSETILSLQNKEVNGIITEPPAVEGAMEANKDLAAVHLVKDKGFDISTPVSIGLKEGGRDSELFSAVQRSPDRVFKETRDQWMKEARESQSRTE